MTIVYLNDSFDLALPNWQNIIAAATQHEPHMLPQAAAAIQKAGEENRLVVAVDSDADNTFVGCIALWPLEVATDGVQWLELGSIFVAPAYRFPRSHLSVADELHRRIIELANGHNLMATTTNPSERKAWQRAGMIRLPFSDLPGNVLKATCVCPAYKIGVVDPQSCPHRDQNCTASVAPETWTRSNST